MTERGDDHELEKPEILDEDNLFDDLDSLETRRRLLGEIVDPTSETGIDDEADAVALELREDDPSGVDRSPLDLEEVLSAEEAAMHLTSDPPFDDDDGYLSE